MDWNKAKTIIIIALIMTNLFLIVNYGFKSEGQDHVSNDQVLAFLEGKNIYIDMEIPDTHKSMPVLEVERNLPEQAKIDRQLKAFSNRKVTHGQYQEVSDAFIKACGLMDAGVVFDGRETLNEQVIIGYKHSRNGVAIEESYMYCIFEDGILVDFKRYWLNVIGESSKKAGIISAADALLEFMSKNELEVEIHVQSMEMIYWLDESIYNSTQTASDTALPAWKITYNDGETTRITAIDI